MRTKPRGGCKSLRCRAVGVPVSLFAYIVCAAVKSTGRVVFFAARREKPTGPLFTERFPASSMQEIQHSLRARRGAVIFDDLRAIQLRHGFLPKAELEDLSKRGQIPLYQIHGVASFYPHFHLAPPPKAEIRVCADMSCHLNGACELRADLERCFANSRPEDVQIRDVSCLGRCDHAPAISINDHIFTDVTAAHAELIARNAIRGDDIHEPHPEQVRISCKADPYDEDEKYGVVRKLVPSKAWDDVLAQLKAAELKGMGGAGFPTSMKWDLVRKQPDPVKYVVCNADESEPGTIKDRFIMTNLPHLLIEGMIIAGLVTAAKRGILYIRHEYHLQEEILGEEIRRCYGSGLLGKKILGSDIDYDLEVFVSPGGYICGEESALLEAIEGKRAEPRNKPPFPGQVGGGLWARPTVINNVETFFFVPVILAKGVDWMKTAGRNGSMGMKFVGVSGDVVNPGVFEVPMGTPYRELIE